MNSSTATSQISLEEFLILRAQLIKKLLERLQEEIDLMEFDDPPEGELWDDLPIVDSKTVVKLSPLLEEDTGMKLKNKWIRRGGYDSADEAIKDLIKKIEQELM